MCNMIFVKNLKLMQNNNEIVRIKVTQKNQWLTIFKLSY